MGDGSEGVFITLVIAGIVSLAVGLGFISLVGYGVFGALSNSVSLENKTKLVMFLFIGLIEGIAGIWFFAFGVWIRNKEQISTGALGSIFVGLLSLNIFAFVAGIYTIIEKEKLIESAKKKHMEEDYKEEIKRSVES